MADAIDFRLLAEEMLMDQGREQICRESHEQWAKARKHGRLRYIVSMAVTAASFSAAAVIIIRLVGIRAHHDITDLVFVLGSIPAGGAIGWIAWQKNERDFATREAQNSRPTRDEPVER